jgi:outer membrane protein assembly factor BamA
VCLFAAHGALAQDRNPSVPSDAELEESGARIGRIEYYVGDVFDLSIPEENKPLYRIANRLHMDTRPSAVQARLLFRTGDLYSRHVLDESERALRDMRYLFDAEIRAVRFYDNTVDVAVYTRDVWTLNPGASFKLRGGESASRFELEDANLFGRGKALQLARSSTVDRDEWILNWTDPNVWGSRWELDLGFADSDDGNREELQILQPFYALDTRRSFGASLLHWDRVEARYALGEVADRFGQDQQRADIFAGWSSGLRGMWTRRWLAGYRYERNRFSTPSVALATATPPPDREVSYPWVGIELLQDDFREMSNLNQIGRVEDLAFGFRAHLTAGWSGESFGATRDSILLSATLSDGFEVRPEQFLFMSLQATSRVEDGSAANAYASFATRYFARINPHNVFYASAAVLGAHDLDPETQILLGGDNGLRGYPLRYQSGSGRALVTLEHRVYTDWYPFRLVRIGGAVFVDAGRTWGRGPVPVENKGWLADAGFGLRFGMSRSGLGNILHVDVAFPLNSEPGVDDVQFQVETKRTF